MLSFEPFRADQGLKILTRVPSSSYEKAVGGQLLIFWVSVNRLYSIRNLAIGIGIQNFPEGLAVSLPLHGSGVSTWKAFWYGQLSGMVEPIAGLLGAVAVVLAEPLLPYALAFAAGAMVYVVVDDIIPEAQVSGNGKLASWTSILGFVVMMSLDVGLG
ncbi:zinc transporter ZIP11-like isoform X1 [Archocentrus centrarchus]|uniref:zinc transporter ZIP11-like isoform X1 n=1 Tax=Archocentrus centrarchus TaxID=63155 RepID=UPI0011E9C163|nr:zinc transporter ZIP11-like isoform X1 [Archocentrus centrarchus]